MSETTIEPEDLDETEAEAEEPTETKAEAEEPATGEEGAEDVTGDEGDEEEPPAPPSAPASLPSNTKVVKVLPKGFVPLPVVAVGDPRVPQDATTLAEAAICAAVFRQLADNAEAHVAAILAADEELPPFYIDEGDAALLAALFATDVALAARIRLAAGSKPREAIA